MKTFVLGLYLFFFFFFLLTFNTSAQNRNPELTTGSKKAARLYQKATDAIDQRNPDIALAFLKDAVEIDSVFIEAWLLMADVLSSQKNNLLAIDAMEHAMRINPDFFSNSYYMLGSLFLEEGKYTEALDNLEKAALRKYIPTEKKAAIMSKLNTCEFGINALKNPVPFAPVSLGDSINGPFDEFMNAITADNKFLYFTRKQPTDADPENKSREEEDFYRAENVNGNWSKAAKLGPPLNTESHQGAMFISPDGMDLYFAGCQYPDGFGSCDIYHCRRKGRFWTSPENIGPKVNSGRWESQPSVSSVGKVLYFASNRGGGKGSSDIYACVRNEDGTWGTPENLGDSINTEAAEMSPFIHPDGQTLYFASAGHPGMGGMDLFYSRKRPDGKWSKAVNLGYPINTYADEISLIVDASGEMAYFSSERPDGKGRKDIYRFELYPAARAIPVTYIKGKVFDSKSHAPLEAEFELIDLKSGKSIVNSLSEPAGGEFLVTLPVGHDYALLVSKKGYLFFSENISLDSVHTQSNPFLKDVPLQPVKVGETVVLNNVFFETASYDLKPESTSELNKLVNLMKLNPGMVIEIGGHTDNVGTTAYNQQLSDNRARVVYEYLVNQSVPKERLSYKGYGQSKPVAPNDTEKGKSLNRRTEFIVTKINL